MNPEPQNYSLNEKKKPLYWKLFIKIVLHWFCSKIVFRKIIYEKFFIFIWVYTLGYQTSHWLIYALSKNQLLLGKKKFVK